MNRLHLVERQCKDVKPVEQKTTYAHSTWLAFSFLFTVTAKKRKLSLQKEKTVATPAASFSLQSNA